VSCADRCRALANGARQAELARGDGHERGGQGRQQQQQRSASGAGLQRAGRGLTRAATRRAARRQAEWKPPTQRGARRSCTKEPSRSRTARNAERRTAAKKADDEKLAAERAKAEAEGNITKVRELDKKEIEDRDKKLAELSPKAARADKLEAIVKSEVDALEKQLGEQAAKSVAHLDPPIGSPS
jgi:hypothetical protein